MTAVARSLTRLERLTDLALGCAICLGFRVRHLAGRARHLVLICTIDMRYRQGCAAAMCGGPSGRVRHLPSGAPTSRSQPFFACPPAVLNLYFPSMHIGPIDVARGVYI